jgi:ketosteroid isomerase-like protein
VAPQTTFPQWLADAIEGLVAGNIDAWMAVYADDAVHEFPFAADGAPGRLEGKDEIGRYMAQIPNRIRFGSFSDVRVREAGDEVIVEADGHGRRLPDETPFDLRYVWIITRRDGRVTHIRDYMSPRPRSSDN